VAIQDVAVFCVYLRFHELIQMKTRFRVLISIFCLGAFATIVQVMFMREMLVAFFGNELTIGTILGSWLVGIGIGAVVARFLLKTFRSTERKQWFLAILLIAAAALLPVQVYAVRIIRELLLVPPGEYASLGAIVAGALAVCFPSSCVIGLFFPFACDVLQENAPQGKTAVSTTYSFESVGSMIAGICLTHLLLPVLTPYQIVIIVGSLALLGAAFLVPCRVSSIVLAAAVVASLLTAALYPNWLSKAEDKAVLARWRSFGVIRAENAGNSAPPVHLLQSADTVYQNLAVTESAGQFTLYANGQVTSVFPDEIGYEHSIHFLMAQQPNAHKILLLGGNPVGDIPQLLKYPVERLVYVELDPGVGRIIRKVMPAQYDAILTDRRVQYVPQDAPRFVRECKEKFDVILINAPEPATVGANRFYTLEFYTEIRRLLADYGFVYTALTSSERLQSQAINLGASVYQTLKKVFPVVLVTAESRNRFFACRYQEDLVFSRALLTARIESANLSNKYFRPEYFTGADEIDPEKLQFTEEKFSKAKVPLNTNAKPVTCFYNLLLWSRFSGSKVESLLLSVCPSSYMKWVKWILGLGITCLLAGLLVRSVKSAKGTEGTFSRLMLGILIGTTGFCGMALEILLIFVFQSLYGYVYTRIGLIVAVFMAGLVVGAPSGNAMMKGQRHSSWLALAVLEVTMLALALAIPFVTGVISLPGMNDSLSAVLSEFLVYAAVAVVGWVVGAEFTVANRLFRDAGGTVGNSAAVTDSWDHIGAALGALLMGVVLVPVFGIGSSCIIIAASKIAGLLILASALIVMPNPTSTRQE